MNVGKPLSLILAGGLVSALWGGGGLAGGISAMPREEGGAPGHLDRVGSPSNYPTELRQRHKVSDTGLE